MSGLQHFTTFRSFSGRFRSGSRLVTSLSHIDSSFRHFRLFKVSRLVIRLPSIIRVFKYRWYFRSSNLVILFPDKSTSCKLSIPLNAKPADVIALLAAFKFKRYFKLLIGARSEMRFPLISKENRDLWTLHILARSESLSLLSFMG